MTHICVIRSGNGTVLFHGATMRIFYDDAYICVIRSGNVAFLFQGQIIRRFKDDAYMRHPQ